MNGGKPSRGDPRPIRTELLEIDIEADGSYARVIPVGEVDRSTAPVLERTLHAVASEKDVHRVVLDLDRVTFFDASGVDVLFKAADGARRDGFDFAVARPSHYLRRLLVMTGVDQFVHLVDR